MSVWALEARSPSSRGRQGHAPSESHRGTLSCLSLASAVVAMVSVPLACRCVSCLCLCPPWRSARARACVHVCLLTWLASFKDVSQTGSGPPPDDLIFTITSAKSPFPKKVTFCSRGVWISAQLLEGHSRAPKSRERRLGLGGADPVAPEQTVMGQVARAPESTDRGPQPAPSGFPTVTGEETEGRLGGGDCCCFF